jgi:hypothetical protein
VPAVCYTFTVGTVDSTKMKMVLIMKCKQCDKVEITRGAYCSNACRQAAYRERTYDASSIKVLHPADVVERWDWAKCGAIAAQYGRDVGWVTRMVQACIEGGGTVEYLIARYLAPPAAPGRPNPAVSKHLGVDAAMRDVLNRPA